MTNDHDALLRAICENPREDTPRLAFADWLEENGQPERAAFIRTDIAMALRDEWDSERIRWENARREQAELTWGKFWVDRVPWAAGHLGIFGRGLPRAFLVQDYAMFRKSARKVFSTVPIEYLEFPRSLPSLKSLGSEPWFPRVTGLEWQSGRCTPQSLRPLLEAPDFSITELAAHGRALRPDGLRAILASQLFPQLLRLRVSEGANVISAPMDAFSERSSACRLRSLTIRNYSLTSDSQLLASALPTSLRVLDITSTRLNSTAMREFAAVEATSGLRILSMASNGIGNDGATAIFTSPHLAGLKVLDLSYCMVGDEALRALLDNSPLAGGLNLLNFTGSPASADMKQAVKDRMGDRVRL